MPVAWKCRRCRAVFAEEHPPGACESCGGLYRRERVFVNEGDVDGAQEAVIEDGVPIAAADLARAAGDIAEKFPTGSPGVDWVFGGGMPKIGAILIASPRGVGKTTFLLTLFRTLAQQRVSSLYISSEQTLDRLAQQFAWIGLAKFPRNVSLHYAVDQEDIVETIETHKAGIYAVDSMHDVRNVTDSSGFELASGLGHAVSQVGTNLRDLADKRRVVIFAVGHVNNDGTIAGGANVQHKLEAVLTFTRWPGLTGRKRDLDPRRILSFDGKNRFAPLGRRALFMMTDNGLEDRGPLEDDGGDEEEVDEAGA